jgi:hypothetical protein
VEPVYYIQYRGAVTDWTSEAARQTFDMFLKVILPGLVESITRIM